MPKVLIFVPQDIQNSKVSDYIMEYTTSEAILTESNQELPISFSLVWGESENASQIIRFFRVFFLQREKPIQQNVGICSLALNYPHWRKTYLVQKLLKQLNNEKEDSYRCGLYLREISHHVTSPIITFAEDIKQEQINIVVQCLVIKK